MMSSRLKMLAPCLVLAPIISTTSAHSSLAGPRNPPRTLLTRDMCLAVSRLSHVTCHEYRVIHGHPARHLCWTRWWEGAQVPPVKEKQEVVLPAAAGDQPGLGVGEPGSWEEQFFRGLSR